MSAKASDRIESIGNTCEGVIGRTAPKIARDPVGRTHACMHALACRSRISPCPAAPRRTYTPTICYNRGLAQAHLYLSTLALGASASDIFIRPDSTRDANAGWSDRGPRAGPSPRASADIRARASAELWGAGTPTSWSSKTTNSHAYWRIAVGRRAVMDPL